MSSPKFTTENRVLQDLLAKAGVDAAAQSAAAQLQTTLIEELHHRGKNMLAIVSSIISQSMRTATTLEQAASTIEARIHALSVAQDLLIRESWVGADCRSLIEGAVDAFQSQGLERFDIAGDEVSVASGPALSLSMIIHELSTNAVKYGSLSVPDGRVSIGWTALDRFLFCWQETGGPSVAEPTRRSFGSRLIETALPGQLRGKARLKFDPAGLRCEIDIPLSSLQG